MVEIGSENGRPRPHNTQKTAESWDICCHFERGWALVAALGRADLPRTSAWGTEPAKAKELGGG